MVCVLIMLFVLYVVFYGVVILKLSMVMKNAFVKPSNYLLSFVVVI